MKHIGTTEAVPLVRIPARPPALTQFHDTTSSMRPAFPRVRGFSLLEAMVALVVLSVGMLGIAALHGHSLAASRSAQLRTQAVNLAGDMADRIRVNRLGGAAYTGTAENNECDPQSSESGSGGVDCTPEQMAAHDLFVWQAQLARVLPDGTGSVAYNGAANPPTYTISVSWTEPTEGTLTHSVTIQVPEF